MYKNIFQLLVVFMSLFACGFSGPSDSKVELDAKEYMEKKMEGLLDFKMSVKEREMLSEDRAKFVLEFQAVRNSKQPSSEELLAARLFKNEVLLFIYNSPEGSGDGEISKGIAIFRKKNNTWYIDSFE